MDQITMYFFLYFTLRRITMWDKLQSTPKGKAHSEEYGMS